QAKALRDEVKLKQVATLKALSEVARESLVSGNRIGLINYVKELKTRGLVYSEALLPSGEIVAHTDAGRLSEIESDPGWPAAAKAVKLTRQRFRDSAGREIVDWAMPVLVSGRTNAIV